MAMKLIWAPPSPYARKARVVLAESGLSDSVELEQIHPSPLAHDPVLVALNPAGKIPALIRDGGPTLYDSRVICRFLDDHAGAGLYPDDRLWEVLTLEATGDAIMDAAILIVYEKRVRQDHLQSSDWVEAQWAKVANILDALESRWLSHLAGPLDAGQIAVGCALGYLDLRHDDRAWRHGRDGLDDWYAAFSTRQSMIDTAPPDAV